MLSLGLAEPVHIRLPHCEVPPLCSFQTVIGRELLCADHRDGAGVSHHPIKLHVSLDYLEVLCMGSCLFSLISNLSCNLFISAWTVQLSYTSGDDPLTLFCFSNCATFGSLQSTHSSCVPYKATFMHPVGVCLCLLSLQMDAGSSCPLREPSC